MKNALLFAISCLLCISAAAQEAIQKPKRGGGIGLSAGIIATTFKTDDFNNAIPGTIPGLKNGFSVAPYFAFNLYASVDDPFFINYDLISYVRKKEKDGTRLEETFALGSINMAYDFLMQRQQSLYGALGFGFATWKASYYSDQPGQSFSNAAAVQYGERTFKTKNMYFINIKGGYSHRIFKDGPFSVGVEAGYRIGVNKRSWELYNNSLNDSPKQGVGGPYAILSLIVLDRFTRMKK